MNGWYDVLAFYTKSNNKNGTAETKARHFSIHRLTKLETSKKGEMVFWRHSLGFSGADHPSLGYNKSTPSDPSWQKSWLTDQYKKRRTK